jgi:hypothetical protein
LGKQLEAAHDSLRMFLSRPIHAREEEIKEELAAKRTGEANRT